MLPIRIWNNDEGIISAEKWKKMLEPYEYNKVKKEYKRFTGANGEAGVRSMRSCTLSKNKASSFTENNTDQ